MTDNDLLKVLDQAMYYLGTWDVAYHRLINHVWALALLDMGEIKAFEGLPKDLKERVEHVSLHGPLLKPHRNR